MTKLLVEKLEYNSPPTYKRVESYRTYLREVSNYSCAYCGIYEAESSGATFNIDHFRPQTYFPNLTSDCNNLRYSCPRCNSYKGGHWISIEQGCVRDCGKCENKVCTTDTDRFIDTLVEDPSSIMFVDKDDKLYAYSSSKVANYTIKYLRLNRMQLIRLRRLRRFMDSWEKELIDKISSIEEEIEKTNEQRLAFIENSKDQKDPHYNIIITMFSLLEENYLNSKIFVEQELQNLNYLKKSMSGRDDNALPST